MSWETSENAPGWVMYGVQGGALDMMSDTTGPGTSHNVTMTDLWDETTYDLQINSNGSTQMTSETTLASEATEGDVVWAGHVADDKSWRRGANWEGLQQPVNPTEGTVTFADAGTVDDGSVTSIMNESWAVGALVAQHGENAHKIDLSTNTLTVNGPVSVGENMEVGTLAMANGGLQIGTADAKRDLMIADAITTAAISSGELILDGVNLQAYLDDLAVGRTIGWAHGVKGNLDLTGATLADGKLSARVMHVGQRGGWGYIRVSDTTGLTDLEAVETFTMAHEGIGRIGDPSKPVDDPDTPTPDPDSDDDGWYLPADTNVTLGDWGVTRCAVELGILSYGDGRGDGRVVASSGGVCTAYVSTMIMGNARNPWGGGSGIGILDLSGMDSVTMNVESIQMAFFTPATSNNQKGKLMLPPGTLTVNDVLIAHSDVVDPSAEGLLQLNGTVATIASSLDVGPRGLVETNVSGASCGLDLAADALLTVHDPDGVQSPIKINFPADQDVGESGAYWGLRWAGNHSPDLFALADAGKLVWDDSAVEGKTAGIIYEAGDGCTYVTLKSEWGLMAVARDLTVEIFDANAQVVLTAADIDAGSFDPRGFNVVWWQITCPQDLTPGSPSITLQGAGDYTVTMTVTNDNVPPDQAATQCTVRLVIPTPTDGDVTWVGGAYAGKEWSWRDNWDAGQAPNNPSPATLTFGDTDIVTDDTANNVVNPQDYFGGLDTQINDACGVHRINVAGDFWMGYQGNEGRIGDPDNAYLLPPNFDISIGVNAETRGTLHMGSANDHLGGYGFPGGASLKASSGGSLTAYLEWMTVGYTESDFEASRGTGILDIAAMDSVLLDVAGTMTIGESTTANGTFTSEVKLPDGTASANELRLGIGGAGERSALLQLNGTDLTASTVSIGDVGTLEINVAGTSCGLDLADAATLTVADGGLIDIIFGQAPDLPGIHYGLRWEGDHVPALQDLADTGKLVWDDSAVAETTAVFSSGGYTYVGLAGGMIRVTQFDVTDATSGSELYTNDATVAVAIAGEPAEGETIVGYLVTESSDPPTEGWLGAAPATYAVQGAAGTDVTLYGWIKDSGDNIAGRTATIYYQPAAPQVFGLLMTPVNAAAAEVTWATDVETYGAVRFKALGAEEWIIVAEGERTDDHSLQITGLLPDTMYKVVVVNNEKEEAPRYYPATWPIEGDATLDCKVNILDLIFIRNRLNQDPATADNWQADVNIDGKINILDLIYVRNRLNTKCPA